MDVKQLVVTELHLLCKYVDIVSIENSSPKIYKFAQLFLHDPLLLPITHELWKLQHEERASLNSLLKKLSSKVSFICGKTKTYIKKHTLTNPSVINELPWLKQQSVVDANVFLMQRCALGRIFKALLYDTTFDHHAFIQEHATIDASNPLNPIVFAFDTDQLEKELHYLHRIEKTREYYALNQIVRFAIAYDPKIYAEQKGMAHKQHSINGLILDVLNSALNRAIGPTKDPHFPEEGFNPRDYKMYMEQLHLYAQKKLSPTEPSAKSKKQPWAFSADTRQFTTPDGTAKFSKFNLRDKKPNSKKVYRSAYGYPGQVLGILTKDNVSRRTIWRSGTLYEAIVGIDPEKDGAQIIYDACDHINKILHDDCDLKDFLIFDMQSVRINPIYLD